jgi:small subunit ribosomal protein S2
VLEGISAEIGSSGIDIGAREELPPEILTDVEPESAAPATA